MSRTFSVVMLFAVFMALAGGQAEAVQRAHVSAAFGLDSNTAFNCDAARPCRFFQAATTVVDPNGELVVLDSGGYGAVTISQSIALVAPTGVYAGISVFPGGAGITVATPGVNVVLRGLTINSQGGTAGISMTAGASLSIENCVVANFSGASQNGIFIGTTAKVRIIDTLLRGNEYGLYLEGAPVVVVSRATILDSGTAGIWVNGGTSNTTTTAAISDTTISRTVNAGLVATSVSANANIRVSIIRSTFTNGAYGLISDAGGGTSVLTISESMVTGNGFGLFQSGTGATLESVANNTVRQNGLNTAGTITTVPLL